MCEDVKIIEDGDFYHLLKNRDTDDHPVERDPLIPMHRLRRTQDVQAIWQPDEFKAASGVVVKSDGDDRAIPPLWP